MAKVILNATEVRNDFFKLIELVARSKKPIFIKKDKEVLVKLEPVGNELNEEWEKTKKILDETRGMWSHLTEEQISGRFREADRLTTKKIRSRRW